MTKHWIVVCTWTEFCIPFCDIAPRVGCTWRIVPKKLIPKYLLRLYTYLDISTANRSYYFDSRNESLIDITKSWFYHRYYKDLSAFIINLYFIVLKFTTIGISKGHFNLGNFYLFPKFCGTISTAHCSVFAMESDLMITDLWHIQIALVQRKSLTSFIIHLVSL